MRIKADGPETERFRRRRRHVKILIAQRSSRHLRPLRRRARLLRHGMMNENVKTLRARARSTLAIFEFPAPYVFTFHVFTFHSSPQHIQIQIQHENILRSQ